MFYLGVFFGENITFAVIEKTLRNLENIYCLKAVSQFSSDTDISEIEDKIISIYNDRKFIRNRRVFSQNRRPAKTVITPPVIVVNFIGRDTARADALRKRKIPAEGISVYQGGQWKKEDYSSICLGNNYYAPEHDLIETLTAVSKSGRLMIADEIPETEGLVREIKELEAEAKDRSASSLISALSLPLWFCENVRIIRRY